MTYTWDANLKLMEIQQEHGWNITDEVEELAKAYARRRGTMVDLTDVENAFVRTMQPVRPLCSYERNN